jgi:hypothetical protein
MCDEREWNDREQRPRRSGRELAAVTEGDDASLQSGFARVLEKVRGLAKPLLQPSTTGETSRGRG